ncbi:hypothetical protein [Desulfotomaculum nigrificans]|uniref:hypothetical protein n=1 Tax=Desulfotomaculum nigrificans TaxID=1565 RepID=UPI001A9A0009|nr:hypothetical protein [Desulfotomaculum nigrificans]
MNYLFQTKITHFYNFKAIYTTDEKAKNLIGVDIAFSNNFKVFDNHVTRIDKNDKVNILSANLNAIYNISRENYYKKYCGSTLLQIWSLYDVPLPKTEEGKMILLAIDSSFKGHYIEKFKKINNGWLEVLEFEELIDVLNRHTIDEFYSIIYKYKLNKHIYINENGILETEIDLAQMQGLFSFPIELPKEKFNLQKQFNTEAKHIYYFQREKEAKKIISLALIYRDKISYTYNFKK